MQDFIMSLRLLANQLRATTSNNAGRAIYWRRYRSIHQQSPISLHARRALFIQYDILGEFYRHFGFSGSDTLTFGVVTQCIDSYQRCLHQRVCDGCQAVHMTTADVS